MAEFIQNDLRVFVAPVDIFDTDLSSSEKLVYIALQSFANPHKPEAFPSYQTLAKKCSLSRRRVIDLVAGLVEKGYITKEIRLDVSKHRKIRNTSNLYTINSPSKVVKSFHHPSETISPPLVKSFHHPSETISPEYNHLTKSFRTKSFNSQSVKGSHSTIESEAIKTAIAKNKKLTDRLTDIETVYVAVKDEPRYSDVLFIATFQKAIKAKIRVPFDQYLLQAMINNMNEQQSKQTTDKPSKRKNDLPDYVKNQLAQVHKEVAVTQELDKEKKKEGLDLLFQLEEIDEREYQKRLNEL